MRNVIKYLMEYLLKISVIGNEEERQDQVSGSLPDVYQHMKTTVQLER